MEVIIGLLVLAALTAITFIVLHKNGVYDKNLYSILLAVILLHAALVLFIHYTGFNPFPGGADADGYHAQAVEIASRLHQGIFSLEGIPLLHYFPVIIGVLYAFTLPAMVIGQLFLVWLVALSVLLMYFLVLEIGGTSKGFLLPGITVLFYPSFLYFNSLLLKESLVIALSIAGLLVAIKICKKFSIIYFAVLFAIITAITHFRFYIGFALLFSFLISWFVIASMPLKKRLCLGLGLVIILGFSPQLTGIGYYGRFAVASFLNVDAITNFREVVYSPEAANNQQIQPGETSQPEIVADQNQPEIVQGGGKIITGEDLRQDTSGTGSSFKVEVAADNKFKFVINYGISFLYTVLGPFFWQLRYTKHFLFLLEVIPWYIVGAFVLWRAYCRWRQTSAKEFFRYYRYALPLVLFSLLALGAISLFINNFGIIFRIRMPATIAIICLLGLEGTLPSIRKLFARSE